jgi:PBSX family phage terminase large subunit
VNLWEGSVRSGKTVGSLLDLIATLKHGPPGDAILIGKTERTIIQNVINPIRAYTGAKMRLGSGVTRLFGRTIYVVGANDERSESKIRGGTYAVAYGDEVTLWPESFFNMLMSRLSVEGATFIGTTNPDGPRHWLKVNFLDRIGELPGWRVFKFCIDDNPHLTPAFVEGLRKMYTGMWYARFIEGKWVAAEGAIYDMFDEGRHTAPISAFPAHFRAYYVAIDYGTKNPFVAGLFGIGRTEKDQPEKLWCIDTYRWDSVKKGRQKTDAEYSEDMRAWLRRHKVTPAAVYYDPSAASFALQIIRDGVRGVVKANNDVLPGIRNVATLLADDRIVIADHLIDDIGEMQGYVWDKKAQDRGEDSPLKANDHFADMIRYLVRNTSAEWKDWITYEDPLAGVNVLRPTAMNRA